VVLVRARDGLAATVSGLLSAVLAGRVPLLWPARVPPPPWLTALAADPAVLLSELAEQARGDVHPRSVVGVCSSGSSGTGKVVLLDLDRAFRNAAATADRLGPGEDRLVASLRSPAYSAGLVGDVLPTLLSGARVWSPPVSAPELSAPMLGRFPPADVHCSAAVADRVADAVPRTIRRWVLSGDLLPTGLVARLRATMPDAELWSAYGLSEAGPRVAVGPVGAEHATGDLPDPLPGIDIALEEGELTVRTPYTALAVIDRNGLRRVPADPLRTGDLGTPLTGGGIRLLGRRSSGFPVGGHWVLGDQVESELAEEGISGKVVAAPGGWLVSLPGTDPASAAQVRRALKRLYPFLPAPAVVVGGGFRLNEAGKRVAR
jgi:acyl-CoA synthetase (AMP-forming)/AMP-acid ligase II